MARLDLLPMACTLHLVHLLDLVAFPACLVMPLNNSEISSTIGPGFLRAKVLQANVCAQSLWGLVSVF